MSTAQVRTFKLNMPANWSDADAGDLLVSGLDQYGGSYEVRVFVNASDADYRTPPDKAHGYIGSFYIYGYGNRPHSGRANNKGVANKDSAVLPIEKRLRIPSDSKSLFDRYLGKEISVTLVPVFEGPERKPVQQDFYAENVALELQRVK